MSELLSTSSRSYEWVLEADIEACFDSIDHAALMCRVRHRVRDRRVIALVKAFLKAGVLTEDGTERDSVTGTPQGGILSPMLANIALSVLDDHFDEAWRAMGNSQDRWAFACRWYSRQTVPRRLVVEMRSISTAYGETVANRAVDFAVEAGEVHALLGENGAGKTTLMKVLFGLVRPDACEVLVGGRPAIIRSPRDAAALGIGMVHQHFMLVPDMTVAENVALGLGRQGGGRLNLALGPGPRDR